jgi:hypothetical protein
VTHRRLPQRAVHGSLTGSSLDIPGRLVRQHPQTREAPVEHSQTSGASIYVPADRFRRRASDFAARAIRDVAAALIETEPTENGAGASIVRARGPLAP